MVKTKSCSGASCPRWYDVSLWLCAYGMVSSLFGGREGEQNLIQNFDFVLYYFRRRNCLANT